MPFELTGLLDPAMLDRVLTDRLFDPQALGIVLGGTALATLAHCGGHAMIAAGAAAARLLGRGFDEPANRKALARAVSEYVRRGYLCADRPPPPDPHLADALEAYRCSGSPGALRSSAEEARKRRRDALARAVGPFDQAGDLAPVFGLVGTLVALTGLAAGGMGLGSPETTRVIGAAVLSTLYGVVAAYLVFVPLGRAIERRSQREEAERAKLVEWAVSHLERARDTGRVGGAPEAAALVREAA